MTPLELNIFARIDDPRDDIKIKHSLTDILSILVCAVMSGAETYEDIELYGTSKHAWLAQFLVLEHGIPSHDTFRRVMMLIDPKEFEDIFRDWVQYYLCMALLHSSLIIERGMICGILKFSKFLLEGVQLWPVNHEN
jgi:hypothetical protein